MANLVGNPCTCGKCNRSWESDKKANETLYLDLVLLRVYPEEVHVKAYQKRGSEVCSLMLMNRVPDVSKPVHVFEGMPAFPAPVLQLVNHEDRSL